MQISVTGEWRVYLNWRGMLVYCCERIGKRINMAALQANSTWRRAATGNCGARTFFDPVSRENQYLRAGRDVGGKNGTVDDVMFSSKVGFHLKCCGSCLGLL